MVKSGSDLTTKGPQNRKETILEATLGEIRAESESCSLERNRAHYLGVCQKLKRYLDPSFRNRPRGQQPPRYRLINLVREAIRLNACVYGQAIIAPKSLHANLIDDLQALVSNGSSETTKETALKMATDICSFVCVEIN